MSSLWLSTYSVPEEKYLLAGAGRQLATDGAGDSGATMTVGTTSNTSSKSSTGVSVEDEIGGAKPRPSSSDSNSRYSCLSPDTVPHFRGAAVHSSLDGPSARSNY